MKIESIDIEATVNKAREMIKHEKGLSPAFVSVIELLFIIVALMANRLNLNSKNSSKPPRTVRKFRTRNSPLYGGPAGSFCQQPG